MATRNFDDRMIKKDDNSKVVLSYLLGGFNPSSHSCSANVSNNELIVEATMDGKKYQDVISNIGLTGNLVSTKASKGAVDVHITKPDQSYSIRSRLS